MMLRDSRVLNYIIDPRTGLYKLVDSSGETKTQLDPITGKIWTNEDIDNIKKVQSMSYADKEAAKKKSKVRDLIHNYYLAKT